jgi:hypothetical protein
MFFQRNKVRLAHYVDFALLLADSVEREIMTHRLGLGGLSTLLFHEGRLALPTDFLLKAQYVINDSWYFHLSYDIMYSLIDKYRGLDLTALDFQLNSAFNSLKNLPIITQNREGKDISFTFQTNNSKDAIEIYVGDDIFTVKHRPIHHESESHMVISFDSKTDWKCFNMIKTIFLGEAILGEFMEDINDEPNKKMTKMFELIKQFTKN